MSSPAKIPYNRIILIDRSSSTPVYIQIAQQLVNAIQRGYLLVGSKLPGSRLLADELGVHRQTIVASYEELTFQGWVETQPNKGTFILNPSNQTNPQKPYKKLVSLEKYPAKTGYPIIKSTLLDDPQNIIEYPYCLDDGQPDDRLYPLSEISSEYTAFLKRNAHKKTQHPIAVGGTKFFKEQLTNILNLTRGLHIGPNHILATRSSEFSLYLLSKVLIQKNDIVVVGDLSYYTANMIFQQAGAKIKTIPIDHDGLNIDALEQYLLKHSIRAVYINPNRHYPTTATLSASRRVKLLQLAVKYQFIILEDEYDFEFQFDRTAVLPLASGDIDGMVVYIGCLGKSLSAGFQSGFIVAPENLIIELRKYLSLLDVQGNYLLEQVLGRMIEEGVIDRHQRKINKLYAERRDLFCEQVELSLAKYVEFQKPTGGLAVWLTFKNEMRLLKFAEHTIKHKLFIPPHLLYQNKHTTAIRVGYGKFNTAEMKLMVEKIQATLKQI